MVRPSLKNFRRIVVKVGSSLLIDSSAGEVRTAWLSALAGDLAKLHGEGRELLVVSSGSIALGRSRLKLPRGPLKLEESQGAAAVGQIALARIWSEVLGAHGIDSGQILVTLQDTEERRRYLNARSTIAKLLEWRAVPIINENDTVATNEIRYGFAWLIGRERTSEKFPIASVFAPPSSFLRRRNSFSGITRTPLRFSQSVPRANIIRRSRKSFFVARDTFCEIAVRVQSFCLIGQKYLPNRQRTLRRFQLTGFYIPERSWP